jgi:predicted metalloprotease with PDZ domain
MSTNLIKRAGWGIAACGVGLGSLLLGASLSLSQEKSSDTQKKDDAPAASQNKSGKTESREKIRDERDTAREGRQEAGNTIRDARQEAGQTIRDARQEKRETVTDARQEARDAVKGARREGFSTGREARQTVRETRRDQRFANLRDLRSADLGLWLKSGVGGLTVSDVTAQGAIAKAGFREGDKIVSINGQPVATEAQFMRQLIGDELLDQQMKIVVMRSGQEHSLQVQPSVLVHEMAVEDPLFRNGIVVDDRDPNRVVVLRVYPRTPAYYAGLRAGDVISRFRGQRIARIADLVQGFTGGNGNIDLQINRGNRTRDLQINTGDEGAEVRTALKPKTEGEEEIKRDTPPRERVPADEKPVIELPKPNAPPANPK